MAVTIKLSKDFSTTHEREFWNEFSKLIDNKFSQYNDNYVLLGNINCDGKELDAIVFKKDAIIIFDFKDGGGNITFSENDKWIREDKSEIKGGSYPNPLIQIKSYKYTLSNFLENLKDEYEDIQNSVIKHTSGIILFSDKIEFNRSALPGSVRPWFHITDKYNIIEKINSITSREINLSNEFLEKIPNIFGVNNDNIQINAGVLLQANPALVNNHNQIRNTPIERILDYFISCLEQEDLKKLYFKATLNNIGNLIHGNNYFILTNNFNNFLLQDQQNILTNLNNETQNFINAELVRPNPRNLFFGYPIMAYLDPRDNQRYLYPKYFCQLVQDQITNNYNRLNDNEVILNKKYLVRAGIADQEESESITDEVNKLNSFQEKEDFLNGLQINNNDNVNNFPILYYSESSNITSNLIKELSYLMKDFQLRQIPNTPAINLIQGDKISNNGIIEDLENKIEIFRLNNSQGKAVLNSLCKKFTLVSGPPGTGKSQVVLNILANAVMQNKKVLFASKNNKAVDIIKERFISEIFSEDEQELSDLIIRIGNNQEMINTIQQLGRIVNYINDNKYQIDNVTLTNTLQELDVVNTKLKVEQEKFNKTETFIKDTAEIENYDYSIQNPFFGNEDFNFDNIDFDKQLNDLERLSGKIKLDILEKFLLWIYPRYYFNKYFKKITGFKNKLPEITKNQFDNNNKFKEYDLVELQIHYKNLEEIKRQERKIKKLKEFILNNDIENIFKNDLASAKNFLNQFKKDLEDKIYEYKSERIIKSKAAFKSKLKKVVCDFGESQIVQGYIESYSRLGNIPAVEFRDFMVQFETIVNELLNFLQIWTVTSLSIRNKIPLKFEAFDLVVIDEASQCDIPSAIPLFYRAKSVCIIGDKLQLKHISGISLEEDCKIAEECGIPGIGGRYTNDSLFDYSKKICETSNIKDVFLDEHYRSYNEIMIFSNKYFYKPIEGREMIYKTLESNLKFFKKGLFWIDQTSNGQTTKFKSNENEVNKIIELYKQLTGDGLNDNISFGITSPFKNQSEKISRRLITENINQVGIINVLGNTVHKFQGDEKDVMFFSPVISFGSTNGMKNFINYHSPQLLNVAISRGRSAVIVVGDRQECLNAGGLLRSLVNYSTRITEGEFFHP